MGLTFRLGQLPTSLFTDASNNVGIGGSPSGSYKLEVTGTAKVSGILTLSSTISNGTYTYTLPSATGTLALTSALSGYLPLTGGTLTGPLTVTVAGNAINIIGQTGNNNYYSVDQSVNNGGKRWRFGHTGAILGFNSFDIYNQTDNITALTLAPTGAATFSSSVTVTSGYSTFFGLRLSGNDTGNTIYNGNASIGITADSGNRIFIGQVGSSTIGLNVMTATGNVLIGTLSDVARLCSTQDATNQVAIQGRTPNGTTAPIFQASSVASGSTSWYAYVAQSGNGSSITTNTMFVYGNGNIVNVNNSYGVLSDISLKENIIDATSKLEDILKLKVKNYNLIADENKTKQIGFIAQEFEEVFPSMVDIDGKSGMKSIKTSVLVPMLVKAIQELNQLVKEQQIQIQNLQEQNQDLKSRLDKAGL